MKKILISATIISFLFMGFGCKPKPENKSILDSDIEFAVNQIDNQLNEINKSGELLNPKTILPSGETRYITPTEWTSGFFPGQLWYLYELTNDSTWMKRAIEYTETLDSIQYFTDHHDIGFMIGCSYGNGLRLAKKEKYKDVIVQAAKSLITRYRPKAKIIQSWNVEGWVVAKGWKCPVIIDNMMNLELLFDATKISGDSSFYKIAIEHGNTTLKNQFRPDNSCYHVIDYDPETGKVLNKHTAQGYSHETIWSRGQAWAVYGYTMMYRYTKDKMYLEQAVKTANMLLNHPNLANDMIPYWDMDAPDIETQPRDVSTATVLASAFYEMSLYLDKSYKDLADKLLENLSKPEYLATLGTNNNFLLKHSVGSIPHGFEIDVPLNYADYYFLEALARKRNLEDRGSIYY